MNVVSNEPEEYQTTIKAGKGLGNGKEVAGRRMFAALGIYYRSIVNPL